MKRYLTPLALLLAFACLPFTAPAHAADDPLPLKIYPSFGRDGFAENPTPPWTKPENLVWIDGATMLDVTNWEFQNCTISTAVKVADRNGTVIGVHVRIYPQSVGEVILVQKTDAGKVLSTFRMFYDPNPLKR